MNNFPTQVYANKSYAVIVEDEQFYDSGVATRLIPVYKIVNLMTNVREHREFVLSQALAMADSMNDYLENFYESKCQKPAVEIISGTLN